ncbi:MAG: hypothetical protein DMG12_19345 [Acidobacteria bacterium]|nr:MAG: hypothetical protein DMG12_19345 [Acidobacteriota bacterium]
MAPTDSGIEKGFTPWESRSKVALVLVFTLCWLITIVVRSRFAGNGTNLDASWLIGLATSLQQGSISGRDFHFTYGPAAQILAWIAASVTTTKSAFDAYRIISAFFCGASALLVAAVLLLYDRINWKQTAVVYCSAVLLNLFYEIPNFRAVLLLLCAAFAYRTVAAPSIHRKWLWAAAAGFICFVSQLVTPELGLYGVIIVVGTLATNYLLGRDRSYILIGCVFLGTFTLANLGIGVFFKVSSPHYEALLDYQRYMSETMRGYNNTLGLEWSVGPKQTIFLALLAAYTVVTAAIAARKSSLIDACLLASLIFASLVSLKSALVRSDIGHVAQASSPFVFVFLLLPRKEWNSRVGQIAWCLFAFGLYFIWPFAGWSAPRDFLKGIDGEVPVPSALHDILSVAREPEDFLPAAILGPESRARRTIPILPFPYENYIPIVLRRPLFAPVLQSYSAATEALQRFYIKALERQRPVGLDVVYGLDSVAVWPVDGIQTISRLPLIFEYLYKHFELTSPAENTDGHYILQQREHTREVVFRDLPFTASRFDDTSGMLRLAQPTMCGLLRLEMKMTYSPADFFLRPSGVEFNISKGDESVWAGYTRALSMNQNFATYFSLVKPKLFYRFFKQGPIPGKSWDTLAYRPWSTDVLGSAPQQVEISRLQCVDPRMFVEGNPSLELSDYELLFSAEITTGRAQAGYAVLTRESGPQPEVFVKLGRSEGVRASTDVQAAPMGRKFSTKLDSLYANDVGIALANPGRTAIAIRINYRSNYAEQSAAVTLQRGEHISKFLSELLPGTPSEPLSGTLQISSESRFSVFAGAFTGRIRALPIDADNTPEPTDQNTVVFPQFVMHGGWATALILSNRAESTAKGRIEIFSSNGDPMPVTLNGITSSTYAYSIPPGNVFMLAPGARRASPSK